MPTPPRLNIPALSGRHYRVGTLSLPAMIPALTALTRAT